MLYADHVSWCWYHMIPLFYRYYGSIFDNILNLNVTYDNDTGRIDDNSTLVVSSLTTIHHCSFFCCHSYS